MFLGGSLAGGLTAIVLRERIFAENKKRPVLWQVAVATVVGLGAYRLFAGAVWEPILIGIIGSGLLALAWISPVLRGNK